MAAGSFCMSLIHIYYESESIAVLQGTGAGRTLYEGGTDAVDYAAVFKPVSYTHLDVYKRQVLIMIKRLKCMSV